MRVTKKHKLIYSYLLLGFFIFIILAHMINNSHSGYHMIEGLGSDESTSSSSKQEYITPPPSITSSPQYTTTQQAGDISSLKNKADAIAAKLSDMQNKINAINLASANNCKKLEAQAKLNDTDSDSDSEQ